MAQLRCTVPFTSVYAGKYVTEDKSKTENKKLNTTQKKQTMQNTAEHNYPALVSSYDARPGNEVSLFYKAPEPTRGSRVKEWNEIELTKLTATITVLLSWQQRRVR